MSGMTGEIREFLEERAAERSSAAQRVALRLLCGLDLDAVLAADAPERIWALAHVRRMMGRERRRGLAGHWSYDLNRHIALKQAAGRLSESLGDLPEGPAKTQSHTSNMHRWVRRGHEPIRKRK